MNAGHIVYRLAGSPTVGACTDTERERCALCGEQAARGLLFEKWQGANFANQNRLRWPGADIVCEACIWLHAWSAPPGCPPEPGKKKGKNLRMYSHLWSESDDEYRYANKADKPMIREWLHAPKPGAWFAAIADTGQKHVLPATSVNPPGALPGVVCFEERLVSLGDFALVDNMCSLLTLRATKGEIERGDYRMRTWTEIESELRAFESQWSCLRGGTWWDLALWLAQRDEMDDAGSR